MSTTAEDLISHLSRGLHPPDRDAFRREAQAAINSPGECWGEGLIHRTMTGIWKSYFHPPQDAPSFTGWDNNRHKVSKLACEPATETDGARYRPHRMRLVSPHRPSRSTGRSSERPE